MFRSSKKGSDPPKPPEGPSARDRILLDALAELASSLDLDEVFDKILARSLDLSGAEQALVLLGDLETGLAARRAMRAGGAELEAESVAFSNSVVRRALTEEKPVIQELSSDSEALAAGQSVFELKLRSVMCTPLRFRGNTLGAIYLDSRVQHKTFTGDDLDIFHALGRQAAIAVQNAQHMAEAGERARLAQELEIAAEIQRDLLPQAAPSIPGLELAGQGFACEEISGDFYDFIPLDGGRVGVFVADVTGHGVGPALLAAEARGEIRALLPLEGDPGPVLSRVHANLCQTIDPGRFLTLFLALIDPAAGSLTYANAGHPPGLLWKDQAPHWLEHTGPPLGVDAPVEHATQRVDGLKAGDGLLLYSDGLLEARNAEQEVFGPDRLAAAAIAAKGEAKVQVAEVLRVVEEHQHGPRDDDYTVLLALWR